MLAVTRTAVRPAAIRFPAFDEEELMQRRQMIETDGAPAAIGPYNQAVRAGDLLFCSGQIPLDPRTGELVEGGAVEQARRCLENLEAVCRAAGTTSGPSDGSISNTWRKVASAVCPWL